MIRFIIAAIFIVAGIFVFAAAAFGVFKFKYVLNRMHVAAKCDSLGCTSHFGGMHDFRRF